MVKIVKTGKVKKPHKEVRAKVVKEKYKAHKKRLEKLEEQGLYEEYMDQNKCGNDIARAAHLKRQAMGSRKPPHTPKQFKAGCEAYFRKVDKEKTEIVTKSGDVVKVKGQVPMTMEGLMLHLGITKTWWDKYEHGEGFESCHDAAELARLMVTNNIVNGGLTGKYSAKFAELYVKHVSDITGIVDENKGSGIKNITFITVNDRSQLETEKPDEDIIEGEIVDDESEYSNK